MTTFRRFLVLQALMLWQGGFLFYASVVVPIGTRVLGSAQEQGMITQQVTDWINVVGAAALIILFWDWWVTRRTPPQAVFRLVLWILMALLLAAMIWLHPKLDDLIAEAKDSFLDRSRFRPLHRVYLWLITVQWAAAVAYSVWMIRVWRWQKNGDTATSSLLQ